MATSKAHSHAAFLAPHFCTHTYIYKVHDDSSYPLCVCVECQLRKRPEQDRQHLADSSVGDLYQQRTSLHVNVADTTETQMPVKLLARV